VGIAGVLYSGFGLLTWYYHALPWWLVAPLGGYLVAWHGSLQHEVVHGHPTPWKGLNELLVLPSLWLLMPYGVYRDSHLVHHADERLTDPVEDPESYYLSTDEWVRCGILTRSFLWLHNTSLGRLALGPLRLLWRTFAGEALRFIRGDFRNLHAWLLHCVSCALVLGWTMGVCRIPLAAYLGLFVYPGLALTLLRSFAEHEAREVVDERSAVVEAGPVMSLLYLYNNLHAVHHAEPHLPWYRLAQRYRVARAAVLERNGGYRFPGYGAIVARYLLRPRQPVAHPLPVLRGG